ncbi:MAG: ADP-glyceromanno-heptose 6-epimerase [Omnitrophica bacterium GWA2_52_8]|nr:MAG: ADP-glyceromanno-heptose 6-epimerase [Omnitrophica bacterium GWA2_52_8]
MIVVTGGAGFIGSCLVWKLNELGRTDILLVDENGQSLPKSLNWNREKVLDYIEKGDFLKRLLRGELAGKIETLFHMGACSATTEQNREYLYENNFSYSRLLAEWTLKNGVQFLYASSAATYGAGDRGYCDEDAITPHLTPLNPYGESKQMFDLWLLEQGLANRLAGFKFFNVYGPNEYHKGDMRSMVHKGYEQIKKEGRIRLFKSYRQDLADGEQKRDFIYVKDVLDVLIWFWRHPDKRGIFNLGAGKAESWNRLAECIFFALGKEPRIEYIEMPLNIRDQYQYWTQADLSKLHKTGIHFAPTSLQDGVADYIRHLDMENPHLISSNAGNAAGRKGV